MPYLFRNFHARPPASDDNTLVRITLDHETTDGATPDPDDPAQCVPIGVSWICPDGFLPELDHKWLNMSCLFYLLVGFVSRKLNGSSAGQG